jgi:hypothetical protein
MLKLLGHFSGFKKICLETFRQQRILRCMMLILSCDELHELNVVHIYHTPIESYFMFKSSIKALL